MKVSLPYMSVATILVILSRCCKQTLAPLTPSHGGSTQKLASIGHAVLEEMFEVVDRRRRTDGRTPNHGYTIISLGEPAAKVSY